MIPTMKLRVYFYIKLKLPMRTSNEAGKLINVKEVKEENIELQVWILKSISNYFLNYCSSYINNLMTNGIVDEFLYNFMTLIYIEFNETS